MAPSGKSHRIIGASKHLSDALAMVKKTISTAHNATAEVFVLSFRLFCFIRLFLERFNAFFSSKRWLPRLQAGS